MCEGGDNPRLILELQHLEDINIPQAHFRAATFGRDSVSEMPLLLVFRFGPNRYRTVRGSTWFDVRFECLSNLSLKIHCLVYQRREILNDDWFCGFSLFYLYVQVHVVTYT